MRDLIATRAMSAAQALSGSAGPIWRGARRAHGRPLVGPYWFILPAVVMLSTVYLGPMIYAHDGERHLLGADRAGQREHLPAGLANYSDVLSSPTFWHAVRVTLLYALTSVVVEPDVRNRAGAAARQRAVLRLGVPLDPDDPDGDHARRHRDLLEAALRAGGRRLQQRADRPRPRQGRLAQPRSRLHVDGADGRAGRARPSSCW